MLNRRLSAHLVVITCILSGGCADHFLYRLARHDAGDKTYTAPLLYPLTNSRPYVIATVTHTNKKTKTTKSLDIRFLVDTGAGTMMPKGFFETLDASFEEFELFKATDATGKTYVRSGGLIDRLQIGELSLRDISMSAAPKKIIGRQVLNALPWTMDLDRGVIIWNDKQGAKLDSKNQPHLKLIRRNNAYHVQARLNQKPYNLVFDTGADNLMVSKDVIETIGSPAKDLKSDITFTSVRGRNVEKKFFPTDVQLDALATQRVAAYRQGAESRGALLNDNVSGLLGFPILARYRFTYVPKEHVIFRPRSSLIDTRRARMERWAFVPKNCKSPGCMTHELSFDKEKDTFHLAVNFEAYYRRPIAVTIGCLTPEGKVDMDRLFMTIGGANASPKKPWKFVYPMKKDTLKSFDLRYNQSGCDESIILDINPVDRGRVKHNSKWVWLFPSILMDHLKRHDYFQAYQVKKKALVEKKKAERKKKKAEGKKKAKTNNADTNKADPNKADTNKADANKADDNKADTNKADINKADTSKADFNKADPNKADPNKADPNKAGPNKAEEKKSEPEKKREKDNVQTGQPQNSETENSSKAEKNNTGATPPAK